MVAKSASATTKVKTETIAATIRKLEAVPEKPKDEHTLRESVEAMKDAIKGVLEKGYSYDEVAAMLVESGISISGATLKQYMAALLKKRKPTKRSGVKSSPTSATLNQTSSNTIQPDPTKEAQKSSSSTDGSVSDSASRIGKSGRGAKSVEDQFNSY